uniref:Uncharacterized protein n=1 Tax=Bacillus thuringiensis TaxID=1428 RepID=B0FXW1_BACTU|nr:hypothetical protein pFR55_ORF008 [Bacillus thuringiensis]
MKIHIKVNGKILQTNKNGHISSKMLFYMLKVAAIKRKVY